MQFIRVNMSEQTVEIEDVHQDYVGLGGRGLTSIMMDNDVTPTCGPFGAVTKFICAH